MTWHGLGRPTFDSIEQYGAAFTDATLWAPYVRAICERHGIAAGEICAGLAGTFPTFKVGGRYVVKLFGDLFDGLRRYAIEMDVYDALIDLTAMPTPQYVADGALFDNGGAWNWPYIVSTCVPGISLGEARDALSIDGRCDLAYRLGECVRDLHGACVPHPRVLDASGDAFRILIRRQRAECVDHHQKWNSLPGHLLEQVDAYLAPADELLSTSAPFRLIHADLTEDHVLGHPHDGHWRLTGIIDYGDALVGDPGYELVALHLGAFACDKGMLRAFLRGYDDGAAWPDMVWRAMSYSLLHEFDVLGQVFERYPAARRVERLRDLADLIWNPLTAGLEDGLDTG
ncbi:MAG TPA: aminoglycoside phosphotransferase family protein [Chloroflexi bacterium]|jgi:hygromycin-B 7''-O-kinase|nr:aminoglycoside phosphotransferase family protein [Chloroflexota bacterium]